MKWVGILILYSLLLTGYVVFHALKTSHISNKLADTLSEFNESSEKYPYLAKRIFIENPSDTIVNFYDLRKMLKTIANPYGDSLSVYFEYLPTGVSIGINEKKEFPTGSLIKVPIAIGYYYKKEKSVVDLDSTKVTIKKHQLDNRFGELWKRGEGAQITLGEALSLMLLESDDTALNVIANTLSEEEFREVYEGFDLDLPTFEGTITFNISTKGMSSILKSLYFSSLLKKENSQEILDLLTKPSNYDLIANGVPSTIPIANKFGIIEDEYYHDCGIVYVPNRNYLLCIISQSDGKEARSRIKTISKEVYNYIASMNR